MSRLESGVEYEEKEGEHEKLKQEYEYLREKHDEAIELLQEYHNISAPQTEPENMFYEKVQDYLDANGVEY